MRYVATGMQGWRRSMEDSHIAQMNLTGNVSVFGVFDGHGGKYVPTGLNLSRLGSGALREKTLYKVVDLAHQL